MERLQIEWLVINALRENLNLVTDGVNHSYNDTIRFAKTSFGALFQQGDSAFRNKATVSRAYEKYEQKAAAVSKRDKKNVTPEDLITQDIEDLKKLIQAPENQKTSFSELNKEIDRLKNLLRENAPKVTHETENMALRNDFRIERPYSKYVETYAGKYNLYKTSNNKQFTLRFLHPDQPEHATGVDLIYEIVDTKKKRIRIISIQYKMMENGTLYFSSSPNLQEQMNKAKICFCDGGYCSLEKENKSFYRLPYCTPFIRPTEKIFNTSTLLTSGWHLPVCEVKKHTTMGASQPMLKVEDIKKAALNTEEFEKLFLQEKIGSRWLTYDEVEEFYKKNSVIADNESIRILSSKTLRK